jgi:hypothetical protein
MAQLMNILQEPVFLNISFFYDFPKLLKHKTCSYVPKLAKFHKSNGALWAKQGYFILLMDFLYFYFRNLHFCVLIYVIFVTGNGELAGPVVNSFNHKVI